MAAAAVGSPCGACRFLRRKCAPDCIFAPYFCCPDQGPEKFAAIHKVFGASNVSKLLLNLPVHNRGEAVLTVGFEAQARLWDPVYGSVAHIYALQQQVACLEAQVMELRAQLGHNNTIQGNKLESQQWPGTSTMTSSSSSMEPLLLDNSETCFITSSISSSIESTTTNINEDCRNHDRSMLGMQECGKKQRTSDYWSELQELALRMMKD